MGGARGRAARAGAGAGMGAGSSGAAGAELVGLAQRVADAGGAAAARWFRQPALAVEAKGDASPVTLADREAEAAMRAVLAAEAPDHAIYGEEEGSSGGSSEYTWILDPIDGTRSFITGKPLFGTLVALVHRDTPIVGIIDQPVLGERWLGVRGAPSTFNGARVSARECPGGLSSSYLYATTPAMFIGERNAGAFEALKDAVREPLYGCDCYAYGLLASGFCDLVCEADLKPYDYMALVPIIEGAGGRITDWEGQPLSWDESKMGAAGEVLAAGDARVHAEALKVLRGSMTGVGSTSP